MFDKHTYAFNAIKFSPLGDTVFIDGVIANGSVKVSVKDQGVGMTAEILSGNFDISKKSRMKGTAGELGSGLGLVICKEFVDQNGGQL